MQIKSGTWWILLPYRMMEMTMCRYLDSNHHRCYCSAHCCCVRRCCCRCHYCLTSFPCDLSPSIRHCSAVSYWMMLLSRWQCWPRPPLLSCQPNRPEMQLPNRPDVKMLTNPTPEGVRNSLVQPIVPSTTSLRAYAWLENETSIECIIRLAKGKWIDND